MHSLPLTETARALGNERVTNMVALGALSGLTGICALASLERAIRSGVAERFVGLNLDAVNQGHGLVRSAAGERSCAAGA